MVPFRSPEGMETSVDDAVPPYRLIAGTSKAISGYNSIVVTNYGVGLPGGGLGARGACPPATESWVVLCSTCNLCQPRDQGSELYK